jgi:hypothetical protein
MFIELMRRRQIGFRHKSTYRSSLHYRSYVIDLGPYGHGQPYHHKTAVGGSPFRNGAKRMSGGTQEILVAYEVTNGVPRKAEFRCENHIGVVGNEAVCHCNERSGVSSGIGYAHRRTGRSDAAQTQG